MRRSASAARRWTFCVFFLNANLVAAAVIVDNEDGAPAYVETGGWSTGSGTGYDGGTYRFATPGNAATATWTGTLETAGNYEIFVWYLPGSNRSPSAKFDVAASDGVHSVYIDQTAGGYVFESLGTFDFNAGDNTITLDAEGSSGGTVVIADAIRFGSDGGGEIDPPVIVTVAPGVRHLTYTLPTPEVVHVLEFDLADPQYTIEMGFPHQKRNYGTSREAVSVIASHYDSADHNIVGAINAAFFSFDDIFMHGMLGSRGNLIQPPTVTIRETYMLQNNGEGWCQQDIPYAVMTARFADETEMTVGALDYTCTANTLAVYTTDWAASTESTTQSVEVVVEDVNYPIRSNKKISGAITAVQTGAASIDNPIPPNGLVIRACSGTESALASHAVVGERVELEFGITPAIVNNALMFTAGNGWLVKDGAAWEPGWYPGFWDERHPRTVLAWSGTKHYFVTFDGRQAGYSVGVSFPEMANFLVDALEVENAINLDGGGSTTLIINDDVANCPSDGATTPCTGTERAVANALMLVQRPTASDFPLADDFSDTGRTLPWDDKFSCNPVDPSGALRSGSEADGYAMTVSNPDGGFETSSIGSTGDDNYITDALIYCDYRPDVATHGFERIGLFARDDGNGAFDSTEFNGGNCYSLTYDSHDGRIRAGAIVDGVVTDFLESNPLYMTSSAWRQFRIFCLGSTIRFYVDGLQIASVTDSSHAHGRCGIGYHEYFDDNAYVHGARVESFKSYLLPFDWNGDGKLNNSDIGPFVFCLNQSGPYKPYFASICPQDDVDLDGDIDLVDFAQMQFWFGAGN